VRITSAATHPLTQNPFLSKSSPGATLPDDSSDSDSDSDSDSEPNPQTPAVVMKKPQLPREFKDDDEGGGPSTQNATQGFKSTNEQIETDAQIMVPDVSSVGPHEVLEHVGEIMSVLDRSIIIRGTASAQAVNGRALDAGSLLVFDDRQVLGHVRHTSMRVALQLNRKFADT
jgi:H/ACA ribonucleoprotein complex non-core subunit NAF1